MEATFQAMAELLGRPEMSYFASYRDDFFVHDRREVVDFGAPGCRYLWAVRESGTHLTRLGIHPRHDQWMAAVLEQFEHDEAMADKRGTRPRTRFFLVAGTKIKEQTAPAARALLAVPHEYFVSGCAVCTRGDTGPQTLASFHLKWEGGWDRESQATLQFQTARPLSVDAVTALRLIGQCIVCEDAGSLLAKIKSITIDGLPLEEYLSLARAGLQPRRAGDECTSAQHVRAAVPT
jgi:hypothetical protein